MAFQGAQVSAFHSRPWAAHAEPLAGFRLQLGLTGSKQPRGIKENAGKEGSTGNPDWRRNLPRSGNEESKGLGLGQPFFRLVREISSHSSPGRMETTPKSFKSPRFLIPRRRLHFLLDLFGLLLHLGHNLLLPAESQHRGGLRVSKSVGPLQFVWLSLVGPPPLCIIRRFSSSDQRLRLGPPGVGLVPFGRREAWRGAKKTGRLFFWASKAFSSSASRARPGTATPGFPAAQWDF